MAKSYVLDTNPENDARADDVKRVIKTESITMPDQISQISIQEEHSWAPSPEVWPWAHRSFNAKNPENMAFRFDHLEKRAKMSQS